MRRHDPITSSKDDFFQRHEFVQNLEGALLRKCPDCGDYNVTGHVIGLEGEWGSGKSSVLNLVFERLASREDCVAFRFVPWMVLSGDHLISYFFKILAHKIAPEFGHREELVSDILAYGRLATYGVDLVAPGVGGLGRGLVSHFQSRLDKKIASESDIFTYRSRIEEQLGKRKINIVCIVDEIDRLTDNEIREVARLLRAVGDFSRISYLVAYDERRVSQALGTAFEDETAIDAGRTYLQKIVSLRIPMPMLMGLESSNLLMTELQAVAIECSLPDPLEQDPRFRAVRDLIAENRFNPRLVIRSVQKFTVARSMIGDEVDWLDLLVFTLLQEHVAKFSETIAAKPDLVIENPTSADMLNQIFKDKASYRTEIRTQLGWDSTDEASQTLMMFLFPSLRSNERFDEIESTVGFNRIRYRAPMMAALRLGQIPGKVPYQEIKDAVHSEKKLFDFMINLFREYDSDSLIQALDYAARHGDAPVVWRAILIAADSYQKSLVENDTFREAADLVSSTFTELSRLSSVSAESLLRSLMPKHWNIVARILRQYVFMHGLYKWSGRNYGKPNIDDAVTRELVSQFRSHIMDNIQLANALREAKSSHFLWLIFDINEDNGEAIRDDFQRAVRIKGNFEGFLKLMNGPGFGTDYSSIKGLMNPDEIEALITERDLLNSKDQRLKLAAQEAMSRWVSS